MHLKPKVLKSTRYNSHAALKKSLMSAETPRFEDDQLKSRKNTFWMKKVVGPQGIQNVPPNYTRPLIKGRRALSSKVKSTQQEQSIDKTHTPTTQFMQHNSKFNIILKHQRQFVQEFQPIFQQRHIKVSYCQKAFQDLNKILESLQDNSLMDSLPSLRAILTNHIKESASVFHRIANECYNLKSQKEKRPTQQYEDLKKNFDRLLVQHQRLLCENRVLKTINHEKNLPQLSSNPYELNIPKINYERVYLQSCQDVKQKLRPNSISIFCEKAWKKILFSLNEVSSNSTFQSIYVHQQIIQTIQSFDNSVPALRFLLEKLSSKDQNESSNLIESSIVSILQQGTKQISTVLAIKEVFQLELKNIRKSRRNKDPQCVTLQQLLVLLERVEFLKFTKEDAWRLSAKIKILKRVRTQTGSTIPQDLLETIEKLEFVDQKPEKSADSTFYDISNLSSVKNKRFLNCMNLLESRSIRMRNARSTSQLIDSKFNKFNRIYIPIIDGVLALYSYFEELINKFRREVQYQYSLKRSEFSTKNIMAEYMKSNFSDKVAHVYSNREQQIACLERYYANMNTFSDSHLPSDVRIQESIQTIIALIVKPDILKNLKKYSQTLDHNSWLKAL